MMGVNTRNMYSCLQICNKLNRSHLFGQLFSLIHDTRTHEYIKKKLPISSQTREFNPILVIITETHYTKHLKTFVGLLCTYPFKLCFVFLTSNLLFCIS